MNCSDKQTSHPKFSTERTCQSKKGRGLDQSSQDDTRLGASDCWNSTQWDISSPSAARARAGYMEWLLGYSRDSLCASFSAGQISCCKGTRGLQKLTNFSSARLTLCAWRATGRWHQQRVCALSTSYLWIWLLVILVFGRGSSWNTLPSHGHWLLYLMTSFRSWWRKSSWLLSSFAMIVALRMAMQSLSNPNLHNLVSRPALSQEVHSCEHCWWLSPAKTSQLLLPDVFARQTA